MTALRQLAVLAALLALVGCRESEAMELLPGWAPATLAVDPPSPPSPPAAPRADRALKRDGQSRVKGHVLWVPPSFASSDGAFDLLLVFHAHRPIVRESVALAKLNAVVVSVNLGEGAGLYERAFSDPTALRGVLRRVPKIMKERGLEHPHLRRIGLASWSAGYGAMMRILAQPEHAARVDAVMLLDGMHARRFPRTGIIDQQDLAPFATFAERAVAGETFMVITHNHIVPKRKIAGVYATSNLLLERLGLSRREDHTTIAPPALKAVEGVYSKQRDFSLTAESIAAKKGLLVRGFAGRDPNDHIAHLLAMAPLALEPLQDRWSLPPDVR